ncbi:DUF3109 family protein [Neolewinella lacunae]|uniref:DUF3109 family protein n=1 Tax=Neolewinella lacunae TaxID=1517758 RepID=A0A923T9J0_9BACT|nr:DUF3109 family protein [Neolewinella lacunae]MBC6995574.1 DUF3109 family protein [Neolewinella lacunae]MDN3635610.1 DUF3109 family protein [Neolewinella lacunae]
MYLIGSVLVSTDVVEEQFACNLSACKGACCWEGDFGAPLEAEELPILDDIYPRIAPLLSPEGRAAIAAQGRYTKSPETGGHDTPLLANGACAYLTKNALGIAQCGIEQAHQAGLTDWKKPISCHLYPIRVKSRPEVRFEALNYDRWDICSAACTRGAQEKIRVFEFARPALERKYGTAWYEELEAAVAQGTE